MTDATQVLFAAFGEEELEMAIRWAARLRREGINTEVYPSPAKMKKQMSYADGKKIPYVAIIGGDELAENRVMLKDMTTGEQKKVEVEELIRLLNE